MTRLRNQVSVALMVVLLVAGLNVGRSAISPDSAHATDCSNVFLTIYDSDGGPDLSGTIVFTVGASGTALPESVIITADDEEIGQAQPDYASSYSWTMHLPARLLSPGPYEFAAEVEFETGDDCDSDPVNKIVNPQTQSMFDLAISPSSINVPVNSSVPVGAQINVPGTTTDFTDFAIYDWSADDIGSIDDTMYADSQFFAGPIAGDGDISVVAIYGMHVEDASITTTVNSNTGGGTQPPNDDDETDDEDPDSGDEEPFSGGFDDDEVPTIETLTRAVENDPLIRDCLQGATGEDGYGEITEGQRRPNAEELRDAQACFARTSFIVPHSFAPVDPQERTITALGTSRTIRLEEPAESERTRAGTTVKTLKFNGQAEPNANVYLYIFSEPLVLSVTADDEGEWQYELENPLEPGEHTAYVVVDRGDGIYERTDALSFVISPVEASEVNPTGLSLELDQSGKSTATPSNRSTATFVAAAGGVLLVAVAVTFAVLNRKKSGDSSFSEALANPDGSSTSKKDYPVPEAEALSQSGNKKRASKKDDAKPVAEKQDE